MNKIFPVVLLAGSAALGACDAMGGAMTAHTDIVARAAGHELTVKETAAFLAANERLQARPEVAQRFANIWVNYTLLAEASSEGVIESLDFSAQVQPEINQALVYGLREEVIQADTSISDEELRQLYEGGDLGVRVQARHILLRVPRTATEAEKDSIRAVAEDLRQRAIDGADFASLASEYSQDPGSAVNGGSLGSFTRGQMVPPFDSAAFSLEVNELSDIVETRFGYHIIKVTDREREEFEGMQATLRAREKARRIRKAEQEYISGLTEPLDITIEESAYAVVRELTDDAAALLSDRAASRKLVQYEGGALTAGEYLRWVRRQELRQRAQLLQATDERLASLLEQLVINEILVAAARDAVPELDAAMQDSLVKDEKGRVKAIIARAGFDDIAVRADETRKNAVNRAVNEFLTTAVSGGGGLWPLGGFAYSLRNHYGAKVFGSALPRVVERLKILRTSRSTMSESNTSTVPDSLPAPNAPRPAPTAGSGSGAGAGGN